MRAVRWIVRALLVVSFIPPAFADDSPGIFDFSDLPELPPVKMGGAFTYTFNMSETALGAKTTQNTATATATPSTYIYEPWLASVNADINLSQSQGTTVSRGESGDNSSESNNTNVTGTLSLNILSQSDYATEVTLSRFDRTLDFGTDTNELSGTTARVSNRLNLPDDWAVQHRIGTNTSEDAKGQTDSSTELSIDVAKRWVEDTLRLGLEVRNSEYTSTDGSVGTAENTSFTLRHRSQPFETVTTDSTSNLRLSTYQQQAVSERSQVMQGVTTGIWRPKDFYDITVSGAFRTFSEDTSVVRLTDTASRKSQTAFGTVATSYVFQPRLQGNLGLNAGIADFQTKNSAQSAVVTDATGNAPAAHTTNFSFGGNGGLDYSSEPTDLVGFSYTWNTGVSSDLSYETMNGATVSTGTHLGHVFSRQLSLLWLDNLNFSMSESGGAAMSVGSSSRMQMPLTHSAMLSHSSRSGKLWDVWNLSFSDNREMAATPSTSYDLANLQITQGLDPDRFSSISISLNAQIYRQVSGENDSGMVDSVNGSISYRERMVLGIENLTFTSDLSFNPPQMITTNRDRDIAAAGSSLSQSTSASEKKSIGFGTQRWSNRLEYLIGKMRGSLLARAVNGEGGMDTLMVGQVSRRF